MDIMDIEKRLVAIQMEKNRIRNAMKEDKFRIQQIVASIKTIDDEMIKKFKFLSEDSHKVVDEFYVQQYLSSRETESQVNYFSEIEDQLKQIPDSNGSKFFQKKNVNVGIISDEFLYHSYKDVANLTYITVDNYKKEAKKVDILLVVTTWRGLNEEWRGVANPFSAVRKQLFEMIAYFKKLGKKVVFYSKEDPINYEKFVDIASKCDYIFTTAVEKVADYKKECNNENVFVLEFGVNPLYHHPIGMRKFPKRKEVFFAGSWLAKYPERQVDTQAIFDGIIKGNREVLIVDRNYSSNEPDYFFPEKYFKYIAPSIPHEYVQKVHKLYDWAINLNSVKYSETMFASRVYEMQALGNIVLTNYNVGINNKFPNIFMVHEEKEAGEIINSMSDEEVYSHQMVGIRNVMTNMTTFDRFDYLLSCIGIKNINPIRKVAVLVEQRNEQVENSFNRQTYEHKELILVEDFNETIKENFDFITFFHPDSTYKEYYLEDMINGFKYTVSDYVTKDGYYNGNDYVPGVEHDYIDTMKNKYRTVFWSASFTASDLLNFNSQVSIPNGYSMDHFEYNEIIEMSKIDAPNDYKLSVIIPVYNNGKYLEFKCFQSLKRSSIFNQMEIILVDDGSTDHDTLMTIKRIEEEHANVKTYYYKDGGSGSASRPRNKGAELATSPFITYLDPDNEAVNDGYATLLKMLMNDSTLDLVVGNILKFDNIKMSDFNYYKIVNNAINSDIITNPIELLKKTKLRAQSIQALIVKREIILENQLKMVENAGGQDTLFFYELLIHSRKAQVVDMNIHIYYAAVTGSVTNTISKKFFNKFFVLEKERLPFLIKNDLLETYMSKRFNFYYKNWYLKRVKYISESDSKESLQILNEIYVLYKKYIVTEDPEITEFINLYNRGEYKEILAIYKQ